jgi:hypothetical protein
MFFYKLSFFTIFGLGRLIAFLALAGFAFNVFCKPLTDFSDLVIPMSEKMQLPSTYLFQTEATASRRRPEHQHTNQSSNSYARLESFTGAIILPNGDRYLGQMKFGIPNGDGLLLFKEGNIFFGGFVNGRYEGDGAYFSTQGEKTSSKIFNISLTYNWCVFKNSCFSQQHCLNGS